MKKYIALVAATLVSGMALAGTKADKPVKAETAPTATSASPASAPSTGK